jgi:hypothetical protein
VTAASDGRVGAGAGRAIAAATLVLGLGALAPWVVTDHYGAVGIPRSDDWSYLVTLFRLVDTGHLSFNHWVSMHLVGQLALGAPIAAVLRDDIAAQQALTVVLGAVALVALMAAARRVGAGWLGSALVAGCLAACPLWGPLAVTFMTDVPTLAASSVATLLAILAWTRRPASTALVVASVAAACFAFSIRQYAIVPVVAAVLTAMLAARAEGRRVDALRWLAGGVALAVVLAGFALWWRTVPDVRSLSPGFPTPGTVRALFLSGAGLARTTALVTLPVLLWARPAQRLRRIRAEHPAATVLVVGLGAAWAAASAVRAPSDAFVGNYLNRNGVLARIVLTGPRPQVVSDLVWYLMIAVASVAAILLALLAIPAVVSAARRVRLGGLGPVDPVPTYLGISIVGYALAYAAAILTDVQVYDRYVLPVAALVALALAVGRRQAAPTAAAEPGAPAADRTGRIAAVVALACLAALGLAYTADSASYDAARWRVARAVVRAGWPARTVNGGFEWNNFHRRDKLPTRVPGTKGHAPELVCVVVHSDPGRVPGRVIAVSHSSAPTRADIRFVAFRTEKPCVGVHRTRR